MPDIKPTLSGKGVPPVPSHPNGYTLPAIEHDGKVIMDSWDIAVYLDKNFPGPPLFPHKSMPLARIVYAQPGGRALYPFVINGILNVLDDRGREHYLGGIVRKFGKNIAISAEDEQKVKQLFGSTASDWRMLDEVLGYYEGPFFHGMERSYADIETVAFLEWARIGSQKLFEGLIQAAPRLQVLYEACQDILQAE